jgi:hypothetical protein
MRRHDFFDLVLHEDTELEIFLQSDIVERVTLHEWPLSCVQRLSTSDGRNTIYKSQFGPTVESEFYAAAASDLLVSGETIYHSGGYVCMLLEHIDAPTFGDLEVSESQTVQIGRKLLLKISLIGGDLPIYLDVSTADKWTDLVKQTLADLTTLVNHDQFHVVDAEHIARLERWALAAPAFSAIRRNPGYVHGDLGGDNLFVLPDGHRVIDWQRTKLGPRELDLATLLESLGFDPLSHVDENVVWVMYLLRIKWLSQCALRWFPEGMETYDRSIARLSSLINAH